MAEDIARRGPKFHRSTIYRWMAAYGPLMEGHAEKIRPWTGYGWHCGEVYFKILGKGAYPFTVMDHSARFILSYMVPPVKMGAEPPELFGEAARRAGTTPWVFVTDGLDVFPGGGQEGVPAQGRAPSGARRRGCTCGTSSTTTTYTNA